MMRPPPLFPDKEIVTDPKALVREDLPPSDFRFVTLLLLGEFYLIIPRVAREVYFLQMLGKNIDVFLPTEGEGLLVRKKAIDSL